MQDLPQTSWNKETETLFIDFTPVLGFSCQLIISGWQQGLVVSNKLDEEENQISLHDLGIQLIDEPQTAELGLWLNTFPQPVLNELKRLTCYREAIAQLACQYSAVYDLLLSNRNLLWLWFHFCLADENIDKPGRGLDVFLQGVLSKQKWMMFYMGLNDSKLSIRLLRKADPTIFTLATCPKVKSLFSDGDMLAKLSHAPPLNKKMLYTLINWPWVAGKPIYFVVAESNSAEKRVIYDTVQMAGGDTLQRLQQCKSFTQVEKLHNRLVAVINQSEIWPNLLRDIDGQVIPFPEPPLKETAGIVAIANPEMLAEEGITMHHCVKSYVSKIQQQKYYVYRMLAPERLTIGIQWFKHKNIFHIEQIQGVCNSKPSDESVFIIESWFKQAVEFAKIKVA